MLSTTLDAAAVRVTTRTDQVTGIVSPVRLDYTYAASAEESRFLRGLAAN